MRTHREKAIKPRERPHQKPDCRHLKNYEKHTSAVYAVNAGYLVNSNPSKVQ